MTRVTRIATTLLSAASPFASAATRYSEVCSGQDGNRASGPGPVIDLSGDDRTLDPGRAGRFTPAGHFEGTGEALKLQVTNAPRSTNARNGERGDTVIVDTLPTFLTPHIDVSGHDALAFTLGVVFGGTFETSGGVNSEDYFDVRVFVDGSLVASSGNLITTSSPLSHSLTFSALGTGPTLQATSPRSRCRRVACFWDRVWCCWRAAIADDPQARPQLPT